MFGLNVKAKRTWLYSITICGKCHTCMCDRVLEIRKKEETLLYIGTLLETEHNPISQTNLLVQYILSFKFFILQTFIVQLMDLIKMKFQHFRLILDPR